MVENRKDFEVSEETKFTIDAKDIIREYRLLDNDLVFERIKEIFRAEITYDVRRNLNMFSNDLLNKESFPKSTQQELGLLIACYKRFISLKELGLISNQSAKPLLTLKRELGFKFANSGTTHNTIKENGVIGRKIVSFTEPEQSIYSAYIKLSEKEIKQLRKDKEDPLTGSARGLQVDHKTPVEAHKKLMTTPQMLDRSTVPYFVLYFQFLSASTNSSKREVCVKCLKGEQIELPAVMVPHRSFFKEFWDNGNIETGTCIGCFWHDYKYWELFKKGRMIYDEKDIVIYYKELITHGLHEI